MRKLITYWREIVRDFGWPLLALFLIYSAVAIVIDMQRSNTALLSDTIMSLIRFAGWLTIIAILVPQNDISIPVRRPLPELIFFCLWGIAEAVALIYFWGFVSPRSPSGLIVSMAVIFGRFAFAILFARVFRYSASDLGIPFKHWRLYLGLIIIIMIAFFIITAAFPVVKHFLQKYSLQGDYFNISVGAFSLLVLFVLYLSNRKRWYGLADDLKSLRPFALPLILCAFVTFGLAWAQHRSQIPWSLPLRTLDTSLMVQGAIPEEFYYRLGLQNRLTFFMPFGWASLLQGIAFAASHFPQQVAVGYLPIGDLLWSFTHGIVNAMAGGYFWYRSKNLPATILFHMAVFI